MTFSGKFVVIILDIEKNNNKCRVCVVQANVENRVHTKQLKTVGDLFEEINLNLNVCIIEEKEMVNYCIQV